MNTYTETAPLSGINTQEAACPARLGALRDALRPFVGLSNCQAQEPEARFQSSFHSQELGPVAVSRIACSPVTIHGMRGSASQRDYFVVCILNQGEATLSQSGRTATQRSGDILIFDCALAFSYQMHGECAGIWVRVPKTMLSIRVTNAQAITARCIPHSQLLTNLASTLLSEVLGLELKGDSPAAMRIATALVDVIAAILESYVESESVGCPRLANMLDTAKSAIIAGIENPNLDLEDISQRVGVSRRTLNRLFSQEGTTPTRWLWEKRLELSKSLLENGSRNRVTDVALSCGFSDFSHFSRAFKSRFGVTPKTLLSGFQQTKLAASM